MADHVLPYYSLLQSRSKWSSLSKTKNPAAAHGQKSTALSNYNPSQVSTDQTTISALNPQDTIQYLEEFLHQETDGIESFLLEFLPEENVALESSLTQFMERRDQTVGIRKGEDLNTPTIGKLF